MVSFIVGFERIVYVLIQNYLLHFSEILQKIDKKSSHWFNHINFIMFSRVFYIKKKQILIIKKNQV